MFKRVWQVVETIFCLKNHFFVKTCENFEFLIFLQILLVQVEENYTKNNDLQYFLFRIKIANALLHVTQFFFFELQIYKKISPKLCLVKLFISLPKMLR